jgi:hypothetical protein
MKNILKHLYPWIGILFFIFLASRALFHEGFFRTIDDVTTVRIQYLVKELQLGRWIDNFPVRWGSQMAHTYGYPFYMFYAPLVYYVGAFSMMILRMSDIVATKFVYFLPLIFGAVLCYWAMKRVVGTWATIIATIMYTLFPYRGFDIYFRGGVSESWAIGFLPGLIGAFHLIRQKSSLGYPLVSIFLSLIILSHNISGLLVFGLAIAYGITFCRRDKKYWLASLLGLSTAAFFWLPSVYYLPLIRANTMPLNTQNILTALIPIRDLVKITLAYTPSQAYVSSFFYLLGACIVWIFLNRRHMNKIRDLIFWSGLSMILYLAMSQQLALIWQITRPISRLLQFPWRLLILLSVSIPLTIGYWIHGMGGKWGKILLSIVVIMLSLQFLVSFKPKEYTTFYNYSLEDTGPCATGDFEDYFPYWVVQCLNHPPAHPLSLDREGSLEIGVNRVSDVQGVYTSNGQNTLMINKYYFPGWQARIDGEIHPIRYALDTTGTMAVDVPSGRHTFRIYYTKTIVMWVADIVSCISISVVMYSFYRAIRHVYA